MENNNKIRELYSMFPELGHEVFEEKIKKPMELYLQANRNVISMNYLNTIIANAMEKSKLGEAVFYENGLFSSPALEENFFSDDTLSPICDNSKEEVPMIWAIRERHMKEALGYCCMERADHRCSRAWWFRPRLSGT